VERPKLITENAELLLYNEGKLQITVLGGIKLTGLDRLKVTLKLNLSSNRDNTFRHNLDLYNSIQAEQLIEKSSEALDHPVQEVRAAISRLTTALENYRAERLEAMKPRQPEKKILTEAERKTALAFLKSKDLLNQTRSAIAASGIVGEETNALIACLVYSSRKRNTPLHLMCLGASGTGKTWLQEKVSELIPEEDKLEITTLSTNAFYYFGRQELKHKLLLIEDLDGAEAVLYPLRELQSKRRISKTVTLKDSKGNLKTVTLNVEGPVCVSGCTTREQLYEDNANRCILLYIDTSGEQDQRIMEYQRRQSAGLVDDQAQRRIKELIQNCQRLLKPITVRNPFATYLKLPEEVFKPRRTLPLLLLFIETITWYHQYQRELRTDEATGEQYIESTVEDVEAAFALLETTLLKKSDELNDACRNFFERLKSWLKAKKAESFHARDVRRELRLAPSSLKRYLWELDRMGYLKISGGSKYRGFEYKVTSWNDLEQLRGSAASLVAGVIDQIKTVARGPSVAQSTGGPLKRLKTKAKEPVAHADGKL
jgi:hypothetical protein